MNPRFQLYARATGAPSESVAIDRDAAIYPGGKMCGYMLWINERWSEWHRQNGLVRFQHVLSEQDHAAFDRWLAKKEGC